MAQESIEYAGQEGLEVFSKHCQQKITITADMSVVTSLEADLRMQIFPFWLTPEVRVTDNNNNNKQAERCSSIILFKLHSNN